MRAEHELVVRCATSAPGEAHLRRIRELVGAGVDWAVVVAFATRHWTVPLLSWCLDAAAPAGYPSPVRATLRNGFRTSAGHSLRLAAELARLMAALEAQSIPATAWKGPTLAVAAYGNLALRTFADLDLLVPARDVTRAGAALGALGYRPGRRPPGVREWSFQRVDGAVTVELHWAIAPWQFAVPIALADLRRACVALGDREVTHLAPEDLLVTLCVHGSKHRWERLQWIADVAELVRAHPELDWARVLDLGERSGTRRMVGTGLTLARDLLETALPEPVARRVDADRVAGRLAHAVARQLFEGGDRPLRGVERVRFHLFHLRTRERVRDRLRYCVSVPIASTWRDLVGALPGRGRRVTAPPDAGLTEEVTGRP
jgi:putative nucleotidyltransferase-like protein